MTEGYQAALPAMSANWADACDADLPPDMLTDAAAQSQIAAKATAVIHAQVHLVQ